MTKINRHFLRHIERNSLTWHACRVQSFLFAPFYEENEGVDGKERERKDSMCSPRIYYQFKKSTDHPSL
jgi:hypothetical protein